MINTKLFLLIGTSLYFVSQLSFAQCVATQDCETLGYTETSCNGGSGVKCPFGNKWACFKSEDEIKQQLCLELGFKYSCSGTGYVSGKGEACAGKYVECVCAEGYEYIDGFCAIPCEKQKSAGQRGCYPTYGGTICRYYYYPLISEEFVNGELKCEYSSTKEEYEIFRPG